MKILFFSYAYPNPLNSHLGTFNRTMIDSLTADHEVRVVSPVPFIDVWKGRMRGKLPRGLNDPQFDALPNVKAEYLCHYYTPKVFRSHYDSFMWQSVQRRFDAVMKEFRPDIVLSYWAHPDGAVAVHMAHKHNVPAAVMVGGSDVLVLGRSGARRRAILDTLQKAEVVIAVSEHIANTLLADGLTPEQVHVVRRGVDQKVFHPGDREAARHSLGLSEQLPRIISVGRMVEGKGFRCLIDACRILAERKVNFRCKIIGDGPIREDLRRYKRKLHMEGIVRFVGTEPQSRLADWYRAGNVTCLPSLSEGVPNVLMESIACGIPFVATNVGGIPEIADPVHDRVVPPNDPLALADALQSVLFRPQEPLTMRKFVPSTTRSTARRLSRLLEEVRSVGVGGRLEPTDTEDFLSALSDSHPSIPTPPSASVPMQASPLMNSQTASANDRHIELEESIEQKLSALSEMVAPKAKENYARGRILNEITCTSGVSKVEDNNRTPSSSKVPNSDDRECVLLGTLHSTPPESMAVVDSLARTGEVFRFPLP